MYNEKLLQGNIEYLLSHINECRNFCYNGDFEINVFLNYEELGRYFAEENGLDISDYNIIEGYIDYKSFAKDMIHYSSAPEYELYIENKGNNRIYQFRKI